MAVTTQNSTEYGNVYATTPPTVLRPDQWYGKLRILAFNFTQSGAGDANSISRLVKLPNGRCTLIGQLSHIAFSAFGASRTLDVGFTAYTNLDGTAVAADEDAYIAAEDVSSAGSSIFDGASVVGGVHAVDAKDGPVIQAKTEGGTIPDAATLKGYVLIAVE